MGNKCGIWTNAPVALDTNDLARRLLALHDLSVYDLARRGQVLLVLLLTYSLVRAKLIYLPDDLALLSLTLLDLSLYTLMLSPDELARRVLVLLYLSVYTLMLLLTTLIAHF